MRLKDKAVKVRETPLNVALLKTEVENPLPPQVILTSRKEKLLFCSYTQQTIADDLWTDDKIIMSSAYLLVVNNNKKSAVKDHCLFFNHVGSFEDFSILTMSQTLSNF